MSSNREIVWSLALGYGFKTAVQALRARRYQVQGVHEGTIAGMAASAWFLANPQFLVGLPDDTVSLMLLTMALAALVQNDWGKSGGFIGTRFYDSTGADDGFA